MGEVGVFDYYYGMEAEQFSFYRIPRLLIKDSRFKGLSSDAKILYGLLLDRMSLSMKNGWLDEENRVYIHYTVDEIMEDLGCAKEKCIKVLAELDSKKGIGLIEKKKQGQGKPDIIYVKNFAVLDIEKESKEEPENLDTNNTDDFSEVRKSNFKKSENQTSRSPKIKLQEVRKSNLKKSENRTSRSSKIEPQEVRKSNPNYINNNYTDLSYINLSINPSREKPKESKDGIDGIDEANTYMAVIRQNLDYDHRMKYADQYNDMDLYQEIYETICDMVCIKHKAVRINGEDCPYELVKSRFLKLNSMHVEYVMDRMKGTTTKIVNVRAYLITALYNAPSTMSHYYQQEVQHDMYGAG